MSRSSPRDTQTHLHVVVVSKQKAVTRARATFIHCSECLFMVRVRAHIILFMCVSLLSRATHTRLDTNTRTIGGLLCVCVCVKRAVGGVWGGGVKSEPAEARAALITMTIEGEVGRERQENKKQQFVRRPPETHLSYLSYLSHLPPNTDREADGITLYSRVNNTFI